MESPGQLKCKCHQGMTGHDCSKPDVEDRSLYTCKLYSQISGSKICNNGGTCVDKFKADGDLAEDEFGFECKCPEGFSGQFCERVDDFCSIEGASVCKYGMCVNDKDSYRFVMNLIRAFEDSKQ